jgi:hypothetical protein
MASDRLGKHTVRRGIERLRGNFFGLLVSLLVFFFGYPFLESTGLGGRYVGFFIIIILIASVHSLSRDRRFFYIALVLAFPALVAQVSHIGTGKQVLFERLAQVTTLLFFGYVTATVLALVLERGKVTTDRLCGAASVYLLMGLTWAVAYSLLHSVDPGAFTGILQLDEAGRPAPSNYFYYSFVTLTTLGYGEIQPVSARARSLSTLESVCGVLYIAILISRLVAMYGVESVEEAAEG